MAEIDVATLGDLEHEMWRLLRRVRRNIAERAHMVHPELSPLGYGVLDQLLRDGSSRATEIGCQLGVDKGAMSRSVHQLLGLDFVERMPDPDDARAAVLTLTAAGQERMEAVNRHRRERFIARMADWSDAELVDVVTGLRRYNATLDEVVVATDA